VLVAALAWTLYHMLQNPDVTERCRKEVDEVMEGRSFPTHEDLKKMKQLDLIMKESMRLTPVSPMGSARDLNADAEICGFAVPKGTSVWVPFYPLFTDAKLWEDPMAFKPERFLDISSSDPKYMPFSAGPRNCTSAHAHAHAHAPTHQRTNAPTHQRTNAPTHQRTNAPTHQRTNAHARHTPHCVVFRSR
jgi:cytochrome P450